MTDADDKRRAILRVTRKGRHVLGRLAEDHARELNEMTPRLIEALEYVRLHADGDYRGGQMRSRPSALRDFTVDRRTWLLTAVAIVIGIGAAGLAVLLLKAIAMATNIFYYHRIESDHGCSADSTQPHWVMLLVPVIGGLIVGFMAHYGSDKIRGHGIPEAIEAILLRGARVDPKVALLKPISAAVAIGSGGPFGAEGPIIMTGGAFGFAGCAMAQPHGRRKNNAAGGGSGRGNVGNVCGSDAAILLAVELLLFEWRPRSLVPVAVASVIAGSLRIW